MLNELSCQVSQRQPGPSSEHSTSPSLRVRFANEIDYPLGSFLCISNSPLIFHLAKSLRMVEVKDNRISSHHYYSGLGIL